MAWPGRAKPAVALVLVLLLPFSGCAEEARARPPGHVIGYVVMAHDERLEAFESFKVFFSRAEVDAGNETIKLGEASLIDLLRTAHGPARKILDAALAPGRYTRLRFLDEGSSARFAGSDQYRDLGVYPNLVSKEFAIASGQPLHYLWTFRFSGQNPNDYALVLDTLATGFVSTPPAFEG